MHVALILRSQYLKTANILHILSQCFALQLYFPLKIKSEFCLTSFVCQPEAHLKLDDFLQLNGNCTVKLIGISHHCQTINEITHSKSILQGAL